MAENIVNNKILAEEDEGLGNVFQERFALHVHSELYQHLTTILTLLNTSDGRSSCRLTLLSQAFSLACLAMLAKHKMWFIWAPCLLLSCSAHINHITKTPHLWRDKEESATKSQSSQNNPVKYKKTPDAERSAYSDMEEAGNRKHHNGQSPGQPWKVAKHPRYCTLSDE